MNVEEFKKAALDRNNYHDFTDGANAEWYEDKFILDCVDEVVKRMKADPKLLETFYSCATGNRMIFVESYRSRHDDNKISINVHIVKSYSRYGEIFVSLDEKEN
jgi:hypothetical protein